MAEKNFIKEVKEKMKTLKADRNAELAKISTDLTAVRTEKAAAEHEIKEASETLDFEKYERAKHEAARAEFKIEMLADRYEQITRHEYLTESESDKVIDGIKEYEDRAAKKYRADIAAPLQTLAEITAAYDQDIAEAEGTMKAWTCSIHANYRSEGTTYANGTNRSDLPVPVRRTAYEGAAEAVKVRKLLQHEDIKKIIFEK